MAVDQTQFSQGRLLRGEKDREIAGGVCAALCDHWLRAWLDHPGETPASRLARLEASFGAIKAGQKSYGEDRRAFGPETGRQLAGARVGVSYDVERTQVLVGSVGFSGMKTKILSDIRSIGDTATWSLRFSEGGGHALAGACGLRSRSATMHSVVIHVFDPNFGEFIAPLSEGGEILDRLFKLAPIYMTTAQVTRKGAVDLLTD